MSSGALSEDYEAAQTRLRKVKLEDFAKEFVVAF
jgi:hypothetical protein